MSDTYSAESTLNVEVQGADALDRLSAAFQNLQRSAQSAQTAVSAAGGAVTPAAATRAAGKAATEAAQEVASVGERVLAGTIDAGIYTLRSAFQGLKASFSVVGRAAVGMTGTLGTIASSAGASSVAITGLGIALVGLGGSLVSLVGGLMLLRRTFDWATQSAEEQIRLAGRTARFYPQLLGEALTAAEDEMQVRMGIAGALFGSAAESMQENITRKMTASRLGRGIRGERDIFRRWGISDQAVRGYERVTGTRMDLTRWLQLFVLKREELTQRLQQAQTPEERAILRNKLATMSDDTVKIFGTSFSDMMNALSSEEVARLGRNLRAAIPLGQVQDATRRSIRYNISLQSLMATFKSIGRGIALEVAPSVTDFLTEFNRKLLPTQRGGEGLGQAFRDLASSMANKAWAELNRIMKEIKPETVHAWIKAINEWKPADTIAKTKALLLGVYHFGEAVMTLVNAIAAFVDALPWWMKTGKGTAAWLAGEALGAKPPGQLTEEELREAGLPRARPTEAGGPGYTTTPGGGGTVGGAPIFGGTTITPVEPGPAGGPGAVGPGGAPGPAAQAPWYQRMFPGFFGGGGGAQGGAAAGAGGAPSGGGAAPGPPPAPPGGPAASGPPAPPPSVPAAGPTPAAVAPGGRQAAPAPPPGGPAAQGPPAPAPNVPAGGAGAPGAAGGAGAPGTAGVAGAPGGAAPGASPPVGGDAAPAQPPPMRPAITAPASPAQPPTTDHTSAPGPSPPQPVEAAPSQEQSLPWWNPRRWYNKWGQAQGETGGGAAAGARTPVMQRPASGPMPTVKTAQEARAEVRSDQGAAGSTERAVQTGALSPTDQTSRPALDAFKGAAAGRAVGMMADLKSDASGNQNLVMKAGFHVPTEEQITKAIPGALSAAGTAAGLVVPGALGGAIEATTHGALYGAGGATYQDVLRETIPGMGMLQMMKRDAEAGHPTRTYLRELLGIPDPKEPAPWQRTPGEFAGAETGAGTTFSDRWGDWSGGGYHGITSADGQAFGAAAADSIREGLLGVNIPAGVAATSSGVAPRSAPKPTGGDTPTEA